MTGSSGPVFRRVDVSLILRLMLLVALVTGSSLLTGFVATSTALAAAWFGVHLYWLGSRGSLMLHRAVGGNTTTRQFLSTVLRWLSLTGGAYALLVFEIVAPLELLLAAVGMYVGFALSFIVKPTMKQDSEAS